MSIFKNFNNISIDFSKCIGTPLYGENGQLMGKLSDFFVNYEEVYPLVIALQYKKNNHFFYTDWGNIKEFSYKKIIIKEGSTIGRSRTYPRAQTYEITTGLPLNKFEGEMVEYPPLGKLILDRQIVDTSGKKVVRVNDIQLIKSGPHLRVTYAAIGLRSMVRRLGLEPLVDSTVKIFCSKAKYLLSEGLINWKFVHAIPNKSIQSSIKLNLNNKDIQNLHPADLADILEDIDSYGRDIIFRKLDPKMAAETLSEVEEDVQVNLIKNETPEKAAEIIQEMDTDDAADILHELGKKKAHVIISKMSDDEAQEEIQELMEYEEDTAGGLMSTEVFEVGPGLTKKSILELIESEHEDLETIYDIYIVDKNNILIGTCPLKTLLVHKENISIGEMMNTDDMKTLGPDISWKEVASYMSKYNLVNLPIVDNNNNELLGIISVDDILPWLLNEK